MKHWMKSRLTAWVWVALGGAGTLGLAAGCAGGQMYVIRGETASVGVDGEVTVSESQEGINVLNVKLVHLPPPERHGEGHTAFVVWVKPAGGEPIKAGKLAYDADDREGIMMATTPYEEVEVIVTSEASYYDVVKPGKMVLVRTKPVRSSPKLITLQQGAGKGGG